MKWREETCGPSIVSHTCNSCSAFNPSKCTHSSEHSHAHTMNTHPEQCAANAVAPWEHLGVWCLAQGSHLSRGIEGGREQWLFTPPPATIPARLETRTRNLRVTSPTLYPLCHDCLIKKRKGRDVEPDFTKCYMFLDQHLCWPWNNIVINQSDLKNKFIIFVKFRLTISGCCLYISVIHLS